MNWYAVRAIYHFEMARELASRGDLDRSLDGFIRAWLASDRDQGVAGPAAPA